MNICSNCGVELDDSMVECPLCGLKAGSQPEDQAATGSYPSDIIKVYKKEVRRNLLELSGIIAASGIIVCTVVDLVIVRGLKWSLFVDVSLVCAWIAISILLTEFRKSLLAIPAIMLNILIMLFLFALFSGGLKWFLPLALPVTVTFFVLAGIIVFLYKTLKLRGFSILGFSFLLLTLFCFLTEIFIDKYLFGKVDIRWSVIAAAAIFPIALIFFFMYFRMKKGKRLDSFFHV